MSDENAEDGYGLQRYAVSVQEADASLQQLVAQMRVRLQGLHKETLDLNDPLLMALSANLLAVERGVQSMKAMQDEVLRAHRSELELLSVRWQRDADSIGQRIVAQVLRATAEEAGQAAQRACGAAAVRIEESFEQHVQQMQRMLWSSSAIVSLGMLAAACTVLFR